MNIKVISFSRQDLKKCIDSCKDALLCEGEVIEFKYPDQFIGKSATHRVWGSDSQKAALKAQNEYLLGSLRKKANIYAIYTKKGNGKWALKYVGQRKSEGMRQRITEHLITKNAQTGSKLDGVREAVHQKLKIGVKFIKVEPEAMRTYVEEEIINCENPDWNIHSKSKINKE